MAAGSILRIRRWTPKDVALVDFSDGSMVTEANLDLANRQAILVAAEAVDAAGLVTAHFDAMAASFVGPPGPPGTPGAASTVPGPPGAASTVPGPVGPASTVPGPTGPAPGITIGNVTNISSGGSATAALRANGVGAYYLDLGLPIGATGSGGSVSWGGVTGTLASQTDLVAALAAKSDTGHTHTFASLTSTPTTLAGYGIVDAAPLVHATAWADITGEPTTLAGYGISDATPSSHIGSGGTAHANVVAAGAAGFMTGADKTKLDGIATAATANSADATLLARANHTGTQAPATIVTAATSRILGRITAAGGVVEELTAANVKTILALAASDVGLGSVNNTADSAKPVSTAQQTALDLKRNIAPTIQAVTSSATVTPTFLNDQVNITAQAAALTLANPTGTAVDGAGIVIRIKDNGTARTIGYGTNYRAVGVTLPTTTVISKTLYIGMIYNAADTKWDVVAVQKEA